MTLIELKRIIFKAPVLALLLFIVPAFVITALVTGIESPADEAPANETSLHEMHALIWDEVDYANELRVSFAQFDGLLDSFFGYSSDIYDHISETADAFDNLNNAYINFYVLAEEYLFSGAARIQMSKENFRNLESATHAIAEHIEFEGYITPGVDGLIAKRLGISIAWEDKGGKNIEGILKSASTIVLTEVQRDSLKSEYTEVFGIYGEYSNVGYDYLYMQYCKTVGLEYSKGELKVLSFMVSGGYTWDEFASPYKFGGVAHKQDGTSPFDFIFNCFELLAIPLILFGILLAAFCIFHDIKKNTVITPLIAPQSRTRVILAKLMAVAIVIAMVIVLFFILYYATAVFITGTILSPTIITTFGGSVIQISPFTLILVYMLSLFFKVMFFATVSAFICINATRIRSIVVGALMLVFLILMLNLTFTVLLPVGIYQFCPLLALDFAGYFGLGMALSGFTASLGVWFALPIMIIIWVLLIMSTVKRFNRKDF